LNKKTLYSARSCVDWAFFGMSGPLKGQECQKGPNLHTNSLNKLLFSYDALFSLLLTQKIYPRENQTEQKITTSV
jgi:hypothetical protein